MCRPKRLGGVGIRNLRAMNFALLMKGQWSFYSSRSLRLLMQKHYRFRSLASAPAAPVGCCPVWKGILSLASPFFTSVLFSLGNGSLADFWNTRWSGVSLLSNLFPSLYAISNLKHLPVKRWIRRFAAKDNLGFGPSLSLEEQQEVGLMRNLLGGVTLNEDLDSISWRWCSNGRFSASSAYNFITFDGVDDRNIRHLWSISIPLRIKLFIWLAGRNRLLTADLLAKRGWQGPSICVLCGADVENLVHLLFRCPFARSMWDQLLQNFPTARQLFSIDSGDLGSRWSRVRALLPGRLQGTIDTWFAAGCWELWTECNRRIFDKTLCSSEGCGRRVGSTALLWTSALGA